MDQQAKEGLLRQTYYNPALGLSSAMALYNRVRGKKITLNEVKEWLKKQETNQIFEKTDKTKIIYPPIIGQNGDYQADLMFLTQYKTKNSGYHILLNFIELTSRKAFSYKLKNKTGKEVIENFKQFIQESGNCKKITVDNGSEFISKAWKDTAKENNIEMVYVDAGDKTKTGKVERFNRTIRTKIMTYLKTYKTLTWKDKLDDLVANYNSSIHSSTGYKPNEVTLEMADAIRKREENRMVKAMDFIKQFKVGDKARVKKYKGMFQKGSDRWSSGIYTIESVEKLSLTLKNPKGVIMEHVKPYNVKLVTGDVEKAPEEPNVPKHSVKENVKVNKFKRKQVREGFDEVTDEGAVVIPERLQPQDEKRTDTLVKAKEEPVKPEEPKKEEPVKRFQVGDKVQAPFKVNGTEKMFQGVVKKLNPKTYHVLWQDGALVMDMKHDEMEPYVEPVKEEKNDGEIKENDRVKGEFKEKDGSKKWYEGTVTKVNPKTFWVLWEDGARLLMKKHEVFKI